MAERSSLQLATLVDEAPSGDAWLHEIKFDGYRIAARIVGGTVTLWSRNGKDWTGALAPIAAVLGRIAAKSATIDGEVVVIGPGGTTSFQGLQRALGRPNAPLVYYAFDLLEEEGRDLRRLPLLERKKQLQALLRKSKVAPRVRASAHIVGGGPTFFAHACAVGAEGIVSKKAEAPYRPGRGRDWLKIKCTKRQEFVIGGYTEPAGSRSHFGALLLGVYEGPRLVFAGRVGTGFDQKTLAALAARLKPLVRPTPPFAEPPRGAAARRVHWVEPKLVAEVSFTEWTGDGSVRHPAFVALRLDKPPRRVRRELPDRAPRARTRAP